MYLLALVLPGCPFPLLLIACVAGTKRGGGRGEGGGRKVQNPPFFPFLPIPYPFQCLPHRLANKDDILLWQQWFDLVSWWGRSRLWAVFWSFAWEVTTWRGFTKRWNPFHSSPAYCATNKLANKIIQIQVNDTDIRLPVISKQLCLWN